MLSLWVPELPFQIAAMRDSRLSDRPMAFLSPHSGPTPTLWLVNRLAKSEGVGTGMGLERAVGACPSLEVLDPEPRVWQEAQASLGEFLAHWTPQGRLGHMGEAMVELGGTQHLFGAPADAANTILKELSGSMGWTAHSGLSTSGTASWLAAREQHGVNVVKEGYEASFLAPYSLAAMPSLEKGVLFRLNRLGLYEIRDLQPVPVDMLAHFMQRDAAKKLLQSAKGEDRPKLPMLADKPNESRHAWRLEPAAMPEAVPLAQWILDKLWNEKRTPRMLVLSWWDADGLRHRWKADDFCLSETPLSIAKQAEAAFCSLAVRRVAVHRFDALIGWGTGRPKSLFYEGNKKLEALEPVLAKLRARFPDHLVAPGWAKNKP
jgi:hypothetical protein